MKITNPMTQLDEFTRAFCEGLLLDGINGELDDKAIIDIAPDAMKIIIKECKEFQTNNAELLEKASKLGDYAKLNNYKEQAGMDFILTRNYHGVGFWDRNLDDTGEQLTKEADKYKELEPYVGDDGLVYV